MSYRAGLISLLVLVPITIPDRTVSRIGAPQAISSLVSAPDTIRMHLAWQIGTEGHALSDSIGELSGIAVDHDGNVYVSDFSATKIWVLDRNGHALPSIGRKGEGPGEFSAPTGIAVAPDGALYVRDIVFISRFVPDKAVSRPTRFEKAFRGPTFSDWRSMRATRFDNEGRIYLPSFNIVDRSVRSGYFYRYRVDGSLVDSVAVPAFQGAPTSTAHIRLNAGGGKMLKGLNHVPFAPLPVWDITPRGTLVTGDGRSYLLRETDATGREVRVFQREVAADAIPTPLRRDSTRALRARLDSVPYPLDRVEGMPPDVRRLRIPETFPAYMAAYAPPDGRLWVRRWPSRGSDETIFDLFEADGRYRHVVLLPRAIALLPTPVLNLHGVAAIAIDRDSGAHIAQYFRPLTQDLKGLPRER